MASRPLIASTDQAGQQARGGRAVEYARIEREIGERTGAIDGGWLPATATAMAMAPEWAEATLTRLSLNELGTVVGGLVRMKPRTPEAEEAIRALSASIWKDSGSAWAMPNSAVAGSRGAAAAWNPGTS